MKTMYRFCALSLAVIAGVFVLGTYGGNGKLREFPESSGIPAGESVQTNDLFDFISINEVLMWVSNNGAGSHNPNTNGNGFYWPGGEAAVHSAIFEDGLIWAGRVNDTLRANGNTYTVGLQAGKILEGGMPDDPELPKYRVYKIRSGWELLPPGALRDRLETDWNEWPAEDGAPWVDLNLDGIFTPGIDEPKLFGQETLWFVSNDLDTSRTRSSTGNNSLGLEIQTTVFGFKSDDDLGDMVFKRYVIINKGVKTVDSMYFGYWTDADLGDASDDYIGCDTTLDLGYAYNSDDNDFGVYGTPPPAEGLALLQGPLTEGLPTDSARFNFGWVHGKKNLPMTSFWLMLGGSPHFRDFEFVQEEGIATVFNYLSGRYMDGTQYVDPVSGMPVSCVLAGDPVSGTGWYEGDGWPNGPAPSDRRHMLGTGPFTFAPGDTQEVFVALMMGQGETNLGSVTALRNSAGLARWAYSNNFDVPTDIDVSDPIPEKFAVYQNYPNPFNPVTRITFDIIRHGHVTLTVYDITGKTVALLVDKELPAGKHTATFDGSALASGIYFYRLEAAGYSAVMKMVLLK